MSAFYMAIYITVRWAPSERASPFPTIYHGENANLELRTFQRATFLPNSPLRTSEAQNSHSPKAPLRKNEIVELCEAFHCERCFPELHSPQSLMLQKSKSVTCVYGDRLSHYLGFALSKSSPSTETSSRLNGTLSDIIIFSPAKRQLCYLKFFGSFFQERTPRGERPRKPP